MRGDYREKQAKRAGLKPDPVTKHGASRVPAGPREGLQLKTLAHPTFEKAIQTDIKMGGAFYRKGGKVYSFPKGEAPNVTYKEVSPEKLRKKAATARQRKYGDDTF